MSQASALNHCFINSVILQPHRDGSELLLSKLQFSNLSFFFLQEKGKKTKTKHLMCSDLGSDGQIMGWHRRRGGGVRSDTLSDNQQPCCLRSPSFYLSVCSVSFSLFMLRLSLLYLSLVFFFSPHSQTETLQFSFLADTCAECWL